MWNIFLRIFWYEKLTNNSNCKIQFGEDLAIGTAGGIETLTAKISNYGAPTGGSPSYGDYPIGKGLYLSATQGTLRVSLDSYGNIVNRGGISVITPNFGNSAGPTPSTGGISNNTGYLHFKYKMPYMSDFVFNPPQGNLAIALPTPNEMAEHFGGYPAPYGGSVVDSYVYKMTIIAQCTGGGTILYVRGTSSAPLRNKDGNIHHPSYYTYGQQEMKEGRACTFIYFNRNWFILDTQD